MTCPAHCKGPGADCLGHCLHRMPIEFAEPEPKDSRTTCALCAYKTHRACGRLRAIRQAIRSFFS